MEETKRRQERTTDFWRWYDEEFGETDRKLRARIAELEKQIAPRRRRRWKRAA